MFHKQSVKLRGQTAPRSRTVSAIKGYRLPYASFGRIIEEYYIALDTPFSLGCLLLYRSGQFDDLVCLGIDPHHYNDADRFRRDFAAVSFLRKSEFVKTSFDTKVAALDAFKQAEETVALTNKRFSNLEDEHKKNAHHVSLLSQLTRKISWFLNAERPDFGLDASEFFDSGNWGPGVSQSIKGDDTSASRKFTEERELTQQAHHYLIPAAKLAYEPWLGSVNDFKIVAGSKVITVPKNAKIDRTIAVEPGLNLFFQKAMGKLIRRKLRFKGYDLNSDRRSHIGAYVGSKFGQLATVDFSAASDTIALRLIEEIFPSKWFHALDVCRSSSYTLDGKVRPFEKISSMGNGFTFELESLVFLAAALVVTESCGLPTDNITVFGDDIIIPAQCVPEYSAFCTFLGFKVNTAKSYATSYFRESCGAYYFKAESVKPYFLKKEVKSLPDVYELHNKLRELTLRGLPFADLQKFVLRQIPTDLRYFGPPEHGRAVLSCNFDDMPAGSLRKHAHWEGFYFSSVTESPVKILNESYGHLLAVLTATGQTSTSLNDVLPSLGMTSLRMVTRLSFTRRSYVARQWCT